LGIFSGRYTRLNTERLSEQLKNTGWEVFLYKELKELKDIPPEISGLMVVGGDGTLRLVFNSLYKENPNIPLIVLPGGTCNAFHCALLETGTSINKEQLSEEIDYSRFRSFHPGLLGDELFIVDIGVGTCEPTIGIVNEKLRRYLNVGQLRPKAAALASWVSQVVKNYEGFPFFDLYSVSPFFGARKMFPEQSLFDSSITHAFIQANSKPQAVINSFWAFFCLGNGYIGLSRLALTCERNETFKLNYPIGRLRVGGDTIERGNEIISKGALVKRAEKSILVSAFSFSPDKQ